MSQFLKMNREVTLVTSYKSDFHYSRWRLGSTNPGFTSGNECIGLWILWHPGCNSDLGNFLQFATASAFSHQSRTGEPFVLGLPGGSS